MANDSFYVFLKPFTLQGSMAGTSLWLNTLNIENINKIYSLICRNNDLPFLQT